MDLKQSKPLHFRCPKCGYDFSANTNHIVEERQNLSRQRLLTIQKMQEFKNVKNKNRMPEYQRLNAKLQDIDLKLQALKRLNTNLSQNAELQKYQIFNDLVKKEIGKERALELIKEAEDCLLYRDYDMAVQRHTNFDNA